MDDLRNQLFYQQKNGYDLIAPEEHVAADNYCRGYMDFLSGARMEREAVRSAVALAEARAIGSDYIVVGRPITQAQDPVAAYERCCREFIG